MEPDTTELRHIAEEVVARRQPEVNVMDSDVSTARYLHELQVHQVELEMQNEELRDARSALEANARQFTELYDFAPVGYFSLSSTGDIRRLNLMGAAMLGRERARLLGDSFGGFVSAGTRPAFNDFLTDILTGPAAGPCEVILQGRNREPVIARLTGIPARDGTVCRVAAMDVTEERRMEISVREKSEDIDRIFNLSRDIMGLATMDGRFIRLNPAFEALLGHSLEEVGERGFMDFVHPDDRDRTRLAMAELQDGKDVLDFTNRQLCGDGSHRWLEWRMTSFRGECICALGRDITDRKNTEEELRKAQDELESRVRLRTAELEERTTQLRALASELTLAEERERRRIATLIHDHLQQMLVAALLNLGMAKSNMADADEVEKIERILRDSIETTRSLTAELSPAVLHQCGLAAALKWLQPWCMEKYGLQVDVATDDGIEPDQEVRVTLFLSVRELLFNIVKHSGVNHACLRMSRTPQGGEIIIEVGDTGAGFDPDVVRAREGTTGGFGLFNIRERLALLGGRLEIDSSPGRGSRFTLRVPQGVSEQLPSSRPVVERTVDTLATEPSPQTIRLVVADDHAVVREGLVRRFQAEPGFEVVGEAADGFEALNLARELRPHFVLMDLNMPHMDGLEATAAIHRELPYVKVLGLSTHADEQHRARLMRAGAVDLLHKDTTAPLLLATLRKHSQWPDGGMFSIKHSAE